VKKQQKKILMVVMGIIAAILFAVKVFPIFFGKANPYKDPEKAKRKAAERAAAKAKGVSKPAKKATAARKRPARRRPPARSRTPARRKPDRRERRRDEEEAPERDGGMLAGLDLAEIPIDLSRVTRRAIRYEDAGRRDPFGPAPFERVVEKAPVLKQKFDLQGILRSSDRRLAIIDNRVFAEGNVIRDGVRVLAIKATEVVLSDGEMEVTLRLNQPALNMGRP
jgi:hypothetical protein